MDSLNLFIQIVETHRYWGYALLYLAMIVEGELFLTAAGMLAGLHSLELFSAFFFALAGVLTGDILWYSVGKYLKTNHSHNKYLFSAMNRVTQVFPGIKKNPFGMIFISKFIYGLNHSTILVLGYLKIEFKRFFIIQFFTSFLWSLIFITIGYLYGNVALKLAMRFDNFVIITLLFLITLMSTGYIVRQVMEKKEK